MNDTVALLGTGTMGAPMARNLLAADFPVRVWNRTRSKAEPLAEHGAVVVDTPAQAAEGADVLVTMLTDGPAVLDAAGQALAAAPEGVVWAQMSTVGLDDVTTLVELAARHAATFVDAPVLGTRLPAEQGTLTVLADGPESVRPRLQPVFDVVGQKTMWLGTDPAGAAATRLKLVLNSWVLNLTNAISEAVALAEGLGVDPRRFPEAVAGGPLDAGYLHTKSEMIFSGDYTPSFTVRNALKDTELIIAAAARNGISVDLVSGSRQRFQRALADGHGEQDMAASYFAGRLPDAG